MDYAALISMGFEYTCRNQYITSHTSNHTVTIIATRGFPTNSTYLPACPGMPGRVGVLTHHPHHIPSTTAAN